MPNRVCVSGAVSAWAVAASVGFAQTVCNRIGPDVIVAELLTPSNYPASGGVDAFSFGTYACNVGNLPARWINNTSEHPVIAQNLYRLSTVEGSTRFEQVGMSWLKHGFFALNDVLCCPTCQTTDGTHLGVGCADAYTSPRNGMQNNLGPRWQVNANTGVFPYPPANPPYTQGAPDRRLQVALADLVVGGQYFAEAQYVTADDAAAGNQNNNASYAPATVSAVGLEYSVQLAGFTNRETPAISAWMAADPAVTETRVQVPGEGLFIISSRATARPGGIWHYEYAVYNMNSDLGGGSIRVPVPSTATVSNVGFRDVVYRNGDGIANVNIDGADWVFQRVGNNASWTTLAFASNPNGNGLRWGTMYNFRFDANVPPATGGSLTLGLWKSPQVALTVAAQVPQAATCYANCDGGAVAPVLSAADYICFMNRYAAGDTYANCDGSTLLPLLNVLDYVCFNSKFAGGCATP
ncbi:MAG: hypothetical protein ACKVW3_09305 [Phycisphaerales bacterium]